MRLCDHIEQIIRCEHCSNNIIECNFDYDVSIYAREDGWKVIDESVYCPSCVTWKKIRNKVIKRHK